jgi:peptidoglycan biosynthesis protein MviN/MurJ (putative lipid II flippase)
MASAERTLRGATHVKVGLAMNVLGTLAVAAITATGMGIGQATGLSGWIGALLLQSAIVAALLSGSRIGRAFVIVPSFLGALGATGVLTAAALGRGGEWDPAMPLLPFSLCMASMGYGGLLATVTPSARAWFRARRETLATRRKAKRSLADWRGAAG